MTSDDLPAFGPADDRDRDLVGQRDVRLGVRRLVGRSAASSPLPDEPLPANRSTICVEQLANALAVLGGDLEHRLEPELVELDDAGLRARLSSVLLTASSAGLSAARTARAISRSPGTSAFAAIHNEHKEIGVRNRATPAFEHERVQRILAGAEHPAGIDQLEMRALPLRRLRDDIARRPGIAVTIARRVPVRRLKSVDFPTFGRPTRTTDGRFLAVADSAIQRSC